MADVLNRSGSTGSALRTGFAFLLCVLALMACGGGSSSDTASPPAAPPPAAVVSLTVVNGHGPASAAARSDVEVWAQLQPQNEIVSAWSGATFATDDEEWHTTVTLGSSNATVTAARQTVNVAFELLTYSAPTAVLKTARLHVPPAPRGLIVLLHGTGGSSASIERTEFRYLALKAISKGYAVLAPEAEESRTGDLNGDGKPRWLMQLDAGNIDLQALDALLASLFSSGRLPANLPRYVLGMSSGGGMAITLGAVGNSGVAAKVPNLRFKAAISYCAQARADAVARTITPSAWFLCGNDDNAEVSNLNAQTNSAALAARGVPTTALLHAATPLYDQRFTRVAGVSTAQSAALVSEFQSAGFLDNNRFFITASVDVAASATANPSRFPALATLPPGGQRDVISQIAVMRGEHEMFSDWSSKSLRWFDRFP